MQDIKVSIVMPVYNHDRFLRQALDSVLMQKTNFNYELIVGEDCSPDSCRDIIKEYEPLFDGKMIPIYRDKNIGAEDNVADCIKKCRGKYLAYLEGDDYWTNENKLQVEVDFLDTHPEYMCVFHNNEIVDIEGKQQGLHFKRKDFHDYSVVDVEEYRLPGHTSTCLERNDSESKLKLQKYDYLSKKYKRIPPDRIPPLVYLAISKVGVLPDCMSAYRLYIEENGTNWTSQNEGRFNTDPLHYYFIKRDMEKCAAELGLSLNMRESKMLELKRAWNMLTWENYPKLFMRLQQLIIVLMEKHQIAFIREYLKVKDNLKFCSDGAEEANSADGEEE